MCFKAIGDGALMKLLNIQIFPDSTSGWGSELLEFGVGITQLFGPNGCGKSPVVQSIAFCLGFPCIFRNDIYEKCSFVVLNIETKKGSFSIKRFYTKSTNIEVTEPNKTLQTFYNEKDYSKYIFDLLDLKVNNLLSTGNKATPPYLSSMLPIFYLDQDEGYSKLYCSPNNFIKDQFSEMMRMLFDLPVRNSFDAKKDKILAKDKLDYLDRQVELQTRKFDVAKSAAPLVGMSPEDIRNEIEKLENDLNILKGSGADHDESLSALDRLVSSHRQVIRNLTEEILEIRKRTSGINQIIHEINAEVETLNLNEEARRIFLSFNEICGSSGCQLLSSSSESYSKNLLYLKDQMKDLERNENFDRLKEERLNEEKLRIEGLVKSIVDERNKTLEKSEISALVDSISEIKNQIFDFQNKLDDLDGVESLERSLFGIIVSRNKALEKYNSYSTDRALVPSLIKIKSELKKLFLKWLGVINTSNISWDLSLVDDFTPVLGVEKVTQLKGSTRIRAVLAYHAALIELMAINNALSFRVLILDTPKQHEVHINDLDCYMKELKVISSKYDIQIIFSTTEYHYEIVGGDKEWNPNYFGEKQKMFLKDQQFNEMN
jgi:hypothetical protein